MNAPAAASSPSAQPSSAAARPMPPIVEVDASRQERITEAQAEAYRQAGLLVLRNVIGAEELAALQRETLPFVENALRLCDGAEHAPNWDLHHVLATRHAQTGRLTPFRQEYVVQRSEACRLLLAHPFILKSVQVLQGPDFTATWDSMVFKSPGHGAIIPWHRDGEPPTFAPTPVFNVDFYLDRSDATNCVWGIPGSNRWTQEEAAAECHRRNSVPDGFDPAGALPITMNPGDVLFHDVKALHGSPWARSHLRRVLYYEFRAADVILENRLRTELYVKRKQLMLKSLIADRAAHARGRGETPCDYRPQRGEWNQWELPAGWRPPTYQYAHEDYAAR